MKVSLGSGSASKIDLWIDVRNDIHVHPDYTGHNLTDDLAFIRLLFEMILTLIILL